MAVYLTPELSLGFSESSAGGFGGGFCRVGFVGMGFVAGNKVVYSVLIMSSIVETKLELVSHCLVLVLCLVPGFNLFPCCVRSRVG